MSAKKTATKKPTAKSTKTTKASPKANAKSKAKASPAKPKIKTVEETPEGLVEVKPAAAAETTAKAKKVKAPKEPKVKKVSALDAAAKVLAESDKPMNAIQMITAMAAKGYWTSPGGKTPHATLYAAMMREINDKGAEARFKKADRGQFALNA